MRLPFVKMHGIGNDFIVADLRQLAVPWPGPEAARALCDRHTGVGADGVLLIYQGQAPGAVARMEVWNADGSQAEMCGNGLRCVAKYLAERDPGLADSEALAIETGAGVLACRLWRTGAEVAEVEVAMGTPRFRRGEIPMDGPLEGSFLLQPIVVQGRPFAASAVSLGNPHLVLFVAGDEPLRELARHYGPAIETHPLFPRRTNVEFARQRAAAEIDLVVWERGCGITLACGTGACATVAAGCQAGLLQEEVPYAVHLPGGTLTIRLSQGQAFMRGPACEVFTGQIDVGRGLAPRPVQAM